MDRDLEMGANREKRSDLQLVFSSLIKVLKNREVQPLTLDRGAVGFMLKGIEVATVTQGGVTVLGEDFTERLNRKENGADTFDPEKLVRFIERISNSIERLNHLGISYFCSNLDEEQLRIQECVKPSGLEVYLDVSSPPNERWLFIGDKTDPTSPLFEIVLVEGEEDSENGWKPHFQIDFDTFLPMAEIDSLTSAEFGEEIPTWKLNLPEVGEVLWMGILGKTAGIRIALGIGTDKRNIQQHRNEELKLL